MPIYQKTKIRKSNQTVTWCQICFTLQKKAYYYEIFVLHQHPLKRDELTKENISFTQSEMIIMKKSNIVLPDAITL